MFIHSIDIKNTYSFGPEGTSDFSNLSKINLIIGKNGSGKTNIARVLHELPIGDINLGEIIDDAVYPSNDPSKILKGIQGEENYWQYDYQDLKIELDEGLIYTDSLNKVVPFTHNRSGNASIFINNSYELFQKLQDSILYYKSSQDRQLNPETDDLTKEWIQFGMYYILGKEITINKEAFDEYKVEGENYWIKGGHSVFNNNGADSYFSIINLLKSLLTSKKEILFLEEPENHIDPRALKRLINFIIYFFIDQKSIHSSIKKEIEEYKQNYNKSFIHGANNVGDYGNIIIQRPTYLGREKRSDITNPKNQYNQIFIISHSPILIDLISSLNKNSSQISSLFEVYEEKKVNKKAAVQVEINTQGSQKLYTIISRIRKIQDNMAQLDVIESLGIKNSDLILANGIIWVEGPSDAIYIKKFINMYTRDNEIPDLEYGKDYLFAMYGGTLLHNYLVYGNSSDLSDLRKITSFIKFNKNFYIIIDSDAIQYTDGVIKDKSKFKRAKNFILNELKLSKNSGIWYDKNNDKYTTIEDYIELDNFKKSNKKVNNSIKIVNYLDNNSDITLLKVGKTLNERIKNIYIKIKSWNS